MPYNPGASYQGGQFIAQGRNNLIQAITTLVGGLSQHAEQTKALRTQLIDVDPANSDRYKKMGLGELQGAAGALEMQTKQRAASLLAQEAQQRIAAGQAAAAGREQLGPFFQAVQQQQQAVPALTSGGQAAQGPPGPGLPFRDAIMAAAGQFPLGAETAGVGRALPQLLRNATTASGTQGSPLTQFSFGAGPDQVSGFYDKAGKPFFDIETQKRFEAIKAKTPSAKAPLNFPVDSDFEQATDKSGKAINGLYRVIDRKTGKATGFFSNPHEPTGTGRGQSLFNVTRGTTAGGAAVAPGVFASTADVKKAYQAGQLSYDQAAGILANQFKIGVAPAAGAAAVPEPAPDEETE